MVVVPPPSSCCGAVWSSNGVDSLLIGFPCNESVVLVAVSAIKPYEGFGDVDHTIKELMSF
jgi:hypothetical protein